MENLVCVLDTLMEVQSSQTRQKLALPVDVDHASDETTRSSMSCCWKCLGHCLIETQSARQATVASSFSESEFYVVHMGMRCWSAGDELLGRDAVGASSVDWLTTCPLGLILPDERRRGLDRGESNTWIRDTQILRKCGFVPNMLDTCLWTRTTKRVPLVFHVDDSLLAGTHQIIHRNPHWIEPRPGAQKQRGDGKTDALLGTNLGKDEGRETTSELMLRERKAFWRSSTCPRSRAHQHCDGNAVRQMRRRCLQANKEPTDSLLEN